MTVNINRSIAYSKAAILDITAVLIIIQCLFLFVYPAFADDCEILKADMYQKEQNVIVTDWKDGIPYRKYTTETYRCADMTFRNNFWQAVYSTDIEVTASFSDGSTKSKKITCGKKRLEPFETFFCGICFETGFPISGLVCAFR